MRAGEYQAACDQFMLVSEVGDAVDLIRQCRYALAMEQQKAGEYEAAAELYESLGVYEDAETRAKYCRYTAGVDALGKGELEKPPNSSSSLRIMRMRRINSLTRL